MLLIRSGNEAVKDACYAKMCFDAGLVALEEVHQLNGEKDRMGKKKRDEKGQRRVKSC